MFQVVIRKAIPGEGRRLSEIALAAKAHWGYPASWLRTWEPVLRIGEGYLLRHLVLVAERAGTAIGFCALEDHRDRWVLEHLWVDPPWHGRGVGRRLCTQALDLVRSLRPGVVVIHSDPHAAGFYVRMGARQTGALPAPIEGDPGRQIPVFEIEILGGSSGGSLHRP